MKIKKILRVKIEKIVFLYIFDLYISLNQQRHGEGELTKIFQGRALIHMDSIENLWISTLTLTSSSMGSIEIDGHPSISQISMGVHGYTKKRWIPRYLTSAWALSMANGQPNRDSRLEPAVISGALHKKTLV